MQQWEWQSSGSCAGRPSEWFFPEDSPRVEWRRLEQQAKRICAGCPVRLTCLEHALNAPEPYGVWGATTASERAARDLRMRTHTPGVLARSRALGA